MIEPDKLETECEKFVERMIVQLPDNSLALNLAAMYFSQTQQTNKAQELWERCVKLDPKDPIVYHNWATNTIHRGESDLALQILDMAEQKGIKDPTLLYQRSICLSNLGRDDQVESILEAEVASGKMTAELWLQLGLSRMKLSKHSEAKECLLRAKELGIVNKPLLNGLMVCSARLKDREAAEGYRKELESIEEKITQFGQEQFEARTETRVRTFVIGVIGEAIEVYRLAGLLDDAEMAALRTLSITPANTEACGLLAKVYRDKKQLANQMAVYERMIELEPGFLLHYLVCAKAASSCGHVDRAESLIKMAIALGPGDASSYAAMADFLFEQGRAKDGIWFARRALELDAAPAGYRLLVKLLRAAGMTEEASKVEAQALQALDIPRVRAQ